MIRGAATLAMLVLAAPWCRAQPITLRAKAAKPRILAGESITIQIEQTVTAPLAMEQVELNLNRTRITVTPTADPGSRRVLTGDDYLKLHPGGEGMPQVGRMAQVNAGQKWTTNLNLFDYTRPVAPGRYRIEIAYRYGETEQQTARANAVDIEVLPAPPDYAAFHRFGLGSIETPRGIWSATAPDRSKHWFYQESAASDPGVVGFAVDVGSDLGTAPLLAHLNDIPASQFQNYAVWAAGPQICWIAVHRGGRLDNPACVDTGLAGAVLLADPPLQKKPGGFEAIVTGKNPAGKPYASLVRVTSEGKASHEMVAIPDVPAAARAGWSGDREAAVLVYAGGGHVGLVDLAAKQARQLMSAGERVELAVDQWMGKGRFWAFVLQVGSVQSHSWPLDGSKEISRDEPRAQIPAGRPAIATFGPESADFALQFDRMLVTRAGGKSVPQGAPLALIATRAGLFTVEAGPAGLRVAKLQ